MICSLLVLITGRTKIEDIHIYDPDSFDNGPQWFLITLFSLTILQLALNQINRRYIVIIVNLLIFTFGYYLGLKKIDDFTNFTKASISIPFLFIGTYFLKIEYILKKYNFVLFLISIIAIVAFTQIYPIKIEIRWLSLPENPFQYLGISFIGIEFILSISYLLEKVKVINSILSFWGYYSIFILCIHWPIIRILYDKLLPPSMHTDIISIIICMIICTISSYAGILLKKYLKQIF